eukprot:CAMPEP_0197847712 /NCGR_PEP_ID=MMETSP1438-20131217/6880_1 /TAXON_ID=1461541 /ORGANISM="Pterosperma sp., Strain CCMP1384" /LENGTH=316 /DNA_ID=CAMNT_0043459717 /DNA_START=107 /DNA_END=1057 /DNA_ORIENTATION=-
MIKTLILATLAAHASAREFNPKNLVNDLKEIERMNSNSTWEAGVNEFFEGWTHEQAKMLLGTELVEDLLTPEMKYDHIKDEDIPASFDARTQWPHAIHPIRNQQQCGSCWAFSASEVLSDRFTIASGGKVDVVLSPEDMVSCDKTDMGCQGGQLPNAWNYLVNTGIVPDKCFPYSAGGGVAPACISSCKDGESWTKYKAKDSFHLTTVADMQKAIMTDGPIQVAFSVYKSFMSYKSGVYTKHWYEIIPEGGHAVKAVGWGTEGGVDYWLIANSWDVTWGLQGYFKIKRGVNECGIEANAYAGHAAVPTVWGIHSSE